MVYRHLNNTEITALRNNGCWASNWELIQVKDDFDPTTVHHIKFEGNVLLGAFKNGTGLFGATIQNCIIEDNVTLSNVGKISNYIVRSNAIIENCISIKADDRANFGLGVKVQATNEGGGREVTLFKELNAQIAYLQSFYKHRVSFFQNLEKLINAELTQTIPDKGIIGHNARIEACNTIHNVCVDDFTQIEGALHLNNGTILSNSELPTKVGHGVLAHNFLFASGSIVNNASVLKDCFVGQGTIIDRQFSGENSLFFANSQLYHGEACSILAAPYTVSHHKSTLLIAGYCGFINIGSGSNQSNHMYKLGPVHQGVLERGCKLGSDSYILWPAQIGAFTFVSGRHYSNPDISVFPFSYLLDEAGVSQLVPGANLRSVGTLRDAGKWPQRDNRKGQKSDLINFELLNPYTIQSVLFGKRALQNLELTQKADSGYYLWGDVKIKKPALKRGVDIYNDAMVMYVGNLISEKVLLDDEVKFETTDLETGHAQWTDMAGMVINTARLNTILAEVENGQITSIQKLNKKLQQAHQLFPNDEWQWIMTQSVDLIGIDLPKATAEELIGFIERWKTTSTTFYTMLLKDAQKEFNERSKIGYGLDENARASDFDAVRGTMDTNSFVKDIYLKIEQIGNLANKTIQKINAL